ncbi:MAG: hypothetical protein WDZ40_00065 [Candidatus Spechtbacterales bacterium]
MKKRILELIISLTFVVVSTAIVYSFLVGIPEFWDAQFFWSVALAIGWVVV